MRIMILSVFVITFLTACASVNMQGRIENGRYFSPNGKIVYSAKDQGRPQQAVRDTYDASIDRGFFEETDVFGLKGMYYTSLPSLAVLPPSNTDERRSVLSKGLTDFAIPNIFLPASRGAEVVHQEFVVEQGNEMLLAVVRLPELSGAFDVNTKKKFDAYPAILVLAEGGYVIILRVQSNITDAMTLDPKERAAHYLGGLRKLKSGLEIRQ